MFMSMPYQNYDPFQNSIWVWIWLFLEIQSFWFNLEVPSIVSCSSFSLFIMIFEDKNQTKSDNLWSVHGCCLLFLKYCPTRVDTCVIDRKWKVLVTRVTATFQTFSLGWTPSGLCFDTCFIAGVPQFRRQPRVHALQRAQRSAGVWPTQGPNWLDLCQGKQKSQMNY